MGQHAKIPAEAAQAMYERFQQHATTLKAERERFHVVSNAPLRRALLPLVGGDLTAYLALVDRRPGRAGADDGRREKSSNPVQAPISPPPASVP